MLKLVEVDEKICRRCLGSWVAKVENPKVCALCKSPYWNKERLRTGESGAVNKYGLDKIKLNEWSYFPYILKDNGTDDEEANARMARSLEQYIRRKDWHYTYKIVNSVEGFAHLAVMRTK